MSTRMKTIEEELYSAIEALERDDLVGVRQSLSRALYDVTDEWQARRKEAREQTQQYEEVAK